MADGARIILRDTGPILRSPLFFRRAVVQAQEAVDQAHDNLQQAQAKANQTAQSSIPTFSCAACWIGTHVACWMRTMGEEKFKYPAATRQTAGAGRWTPYKGFPNLFRPFFVLFSPLHPILSVIRMFPDQRRSRTGKKSRPHTAAHPHNHPRNGIGRSACGKNATQGNDNSRARRIG